jgi:dynein heavy chain
MPQLDAGKAQPPVELLRQVLDHGGFYDTKKLFFKKVADTRFVAACAPPGGGRNEVTPRLFRQYTMIWVPQLSKEAMNTIFVSILRGYVDLKEDPALSLLTEDIISACVDTYLQAILTFLPTPSKCHYTFNLRDLSKVVQGMLMCPVDEIPDKDYLVKLFANEVFRVFRDRLINSDDRKNLSKVLHGFMEKKLKLGWELDSFENVIFGDYDNQKRFYLMLGETESLIPKLEELLMVYNSEHSQMNLVFFEDCIQHLTRIARTLKQERGNALLVGLGGSGRRSMAMFGGGMNEIDTFGIEITKSYREKEFHEDIKSLMRICGVEGKDMQFLFSDTQIVMESFLEDINNLLNSGEIPNLFPPDEKVAICEEIESKAREDGEGNGRDAQFNWFVS